MAGEDQGSKTAPARKKFVPKVAPRRKDRSNAAAAVASDGPSTSGANPNADVFKELMQAAEREKDLGQGGRGRGRGAPHARHVRVGFQAPGGAAGAKGGGGGGGGRGGAAGPSPTSMRSKGPKKEDGAAEAPRLLRGGGPGVPQFRVHQPPPERAEPRRRLRDLFDGDSYYPEVLPMARLGDVVQEEADGGELRLPNLMDAQDDPGHPAGELELHDAHAFAKRDHDKFVYCFQLPPLPARAPSGEAASDVAAMPAGRIGKLRIFESGRMQMVLGEVAMSVAAGVRCSFKQHAAAMNVATNSAVFFGEVAHRAVVAPDVDQLLDDVPVPECERGDPDVLRRGGNDFREGAGLLSPRVLSPRVMSPRRQKVKQESKMDVDIKSPPRAPMPELAPKPSMANGSRRGHVAVDLEDMEEDKPLVGMQDGVDDFVEEGYAAGGGDNDSD